MEERALGSWGTASLGDVVVDIAAVVWKRGLVRAVGMLERRRLLFVSRLESGRSVEVRERLYMEMEGRSFCICSEMRATRRQERITRSAEGKRLAIRKS